MDPDAQHRMSFSVGPVKRLSFHVPSSPQTPTAIHRQPCRTTTTKHVTSAHPSLSHRTNKSSCHMSKSRYQSTALAYLVSGELHSRSVWHPSPRTIHSTPARCLETNSRQRIIIDSIRGYHRVEDVRPPRPRSSLFLRRHLGRPPRYRRLWFLQPHGRHPMVPMARDHVG
jgi:hypothetical protein